MQTQKQKMLSGKNYDASDAELLAERKRARALLHQVNHVLAPDTPKHQEAKAELFPNVSPKAFITTPVYCDYGYNLFMDEGSYMNFGCTILDGMKVSLGKNTLVGPNVQFYTASHPLDVSERRAGVEFSVAIDIGEDCWIGGMAVILPGVKIGDRCIIGAGAVVTKDIPDDSIAVGNPAKVMKK